jgi:hypothetical protein
MIPCRPPRLDKMANQITRSVCDRRASSSRTQIELSKRRSTPGKPGCMNPDDPWGHKTLGLFHVPMYRLESYGGRCFAVYAAKLWNGLDVSVRTGPTVGAFKKGLKNTLFLW